MIKASKDNKTFYKELRNEGRLEAEKEKEEFYATFSKQEEEKKEMQKAFEATINALLLNHRETVSSIVENHSNQTSAFLRVFDQFHQTLPWLSGSDIRVRPAEATEPTDNITGFSCFTGNYDGNRGDISYLAGVVLVNRASPDNVAFMFGRQESSTIGTFDITNNDSNCHGMSGVFSWADTVLSDTATGDAEGWDDYQDGNSLSDNWGTPATGKNQKGFFRDCN
jgi:hypothetical protein